MSENLKTSPQCEDKGMVPYSYKFVTVSGYWFIGSFICIVRRLWN